MKQAGYMKIGLKILNRKADEKMNTKKFKTRTEFIERKNVKVNGIWHIGLDIGYSSVKAYHPNGVSTFPYAAEKTDNVDFAGKTPKDAIIYKDLDTDETWLVGEYASNSIGASDTSNSESVLYGRDRTKDEMFMVIARAGIGISMLGNSYGESGNDRIVIQTGLPERYLESGHSDVIDLTDALSGNHNFALKVGERGWHFFNISINKDDVHIISQPKASLFGICISNDGRIVPKYKNLINESVIVFDPGFGTFDLFIINRGRVLKGETFTNLGMKRVFEECSKLIMENTNQHIPVYAMQSYLEKGTVNNIIEVDGKYRREEYPFDKLLAEASNKVCDEAIKKMIKAVGMDSLKQGMSALIVTGGTGAAWLHNIEEQLGGIIPIVKGNENDNTLASIYNNARGYYLYRYTKLLKEG